VKFLPFCFLVFGFIANALSCNIYVTIDGHKFISEKSVGILLTDGPKDEFEISFDFQELPTGSFGKNIQPSSLTCNELIGELTNEKLGMKYFATVDSEDVPLFIAYHGKIEGQRFSFYKEFEVIGKAYWDIVLKR
jgi:hypothetical protein